MASQDSVGYPVSRLQFAPQDRASDQRGFSPRELRSRPGGAAWAFALLPTPRVFRLREPLHRPWTLAFSVALRIDTGESTPRILCASHPKAWNSESSSQVCIVHAPVKTRTFRTPEHLWLVWSEPCDPKRLFN